MSKIVIDSAVVEQALEALNAGVKISPNSVLHDRLRAALEQPQVEQEPVATVSIVIDGSRTMIDMEWNDRLAELPAGNHRLYTHTQNLNCKSTQARLATLWGYEKKQPPRQPLTDGQINDYRLALAYDSEDLPDPWDFREGFRAAERSHRIGGEK